jgi:hypothetical protein
MPSTNKEEKVIRSRSYLVEIAAQIALAAAIGLFVSIVLAGAAMLLAGSAQAAGGLQFKTSRSTPPWTGCACASASAS